MAVLRKIALGLLLASAAVVLVTASWELWDYRQSAYLRLNETGLNTDDRARILDDRMELLTRRVGDMEKLVLILLGTSGLYAIVFVVSSYVSTTTFARQADQTISHIQDQIGLAMGDLRELQEETEQQLHQMTANASAVAPAPAAKPPDQRLQPTAPAQTPADWAAQIAEIAARLEAWQDRSLGEQARLELVRAEHSAISIEVTAGSHASSALAELYLGFGRIYTSSNAGLCDTARSRFFLERALRLAAPESPLASEIHYQLACQFAASHDFPYAVRELAAAFEHQFKSLDERLAGDIEEGGKLYELASTAPFDKAVNDLLLNMSIGIG
ncbi:MAG: hypothetical protein ACLPWF_30730 [Bryobacteraceae bacterium]